MKYIRTDIGIFESKKRNQNPKMFECLWGSILKEADTIEELCDEFRELLPRYKGNDIIGYEPEKWEYSTSDGKFYNDIGECCYRKDFVTRGYVVYGAIWTDKGLIYVAKMNNKGELELI